MPAHDWTRADDGFFHFFHNSWLTHLAERLNGGGLPAGYFAMSDQRADIHVPDVLALATNGARPADGAGVAVAEPRADRQVALAVRRPVVRRRVFVRNARRVVAVVEVVSPGNKSGPERVREFAAKAADLLAGGVHLAVVDLLPPGPADPAGMHAAIGKKLGAGKKTVTQPPADRPLTLAGYQAGAPVHAYLNYAAVGRPLPPVPLFLDGGRFVDLPLEETYMTGYTRLPAELRELLDTPPAAGAG